MAAVEQIVYDPQDPWPGGPAHEVDRRARAHIEFLHLDAGDLKTYSDALHHVLHSDPQLASAYAAAPTGETALMPPAPGARTGVGPALLAQLVDLLGKLAAAQGKKSPTLQEVVDMFPQVKAAYLKGEL
jgi:hypothetical protein